MTANDLFLNDRIKNISEQQVKAGTHYSEKDMKRRLGGYRNANEAPNGNPSICDFFDEYKNDTIEIKDVDIKTLN